jgi:propanol-preferring alcohol dehydrogenase
MGGKGAVVVDIDHGRLFGGAAPWSLPLIPMKAATIAGSYTGNLDLARSGAVPNIPIQRRPLSDASEALEGLKAGRVVGRVVLTP